MKSETKLSHVWIPIFFIFIIDGLCIGFLYDLEDKLPLWLKIILIFIIIAYPIFNIFCILSIPKIELIEDRVIEKIRGKTQEINFNELRSLKPNVFINRLNKIGRAYELESDKGIKIYIQTKIYKNEEILLKYLKSKINLES